MKRVWVVAAALLLSAAHAGAESLYEQNGFRPLTGDRKAFKVGDVLTIQVYESATAASSADTSTRRRNHLAAELAHGQGKGGSVGVTAGGDFDGGGRTQRTNRFLTTVSVAVTEVLPNGDLQVQGEQVLTLNEEAQRVTLQGRVRPLDISDGNVVPSNRLADARIAFSGAGDLSERQQRGWWRKLVDWMGL